MGAEGPQKVEHKLNKRASFGVFFSTVLLSRKVNELYCTQSMSSAALTRIPLKCKKVKTIRAVKCATAVCKI